MGTTEIIVIASVGLVMFGPARIPDLALGHFTLLKRLPSGLPAIVITGLDVAAPMGAAALLRKDELTRGRLAFAIRRVIQAVR